MRAFTTWKKTTIMNNLMKTSNRYAIITFLLFILAAGISWAADNIGPEPAPWWQRVEEAQALAIKWIGALTIIIGALATLIAFVIGKVSELKARIENQNRRQDAQQQQITNIATAIPPAILPGDSNGGAQNK